MNSKFIAICIFFIIALGAVSTPDKKLAIAKSSPYGIVSLELAANTATANAIKHDWDTTYFQEQNCCEGAQPVKLSEYALDSVLWDFAFIPAYCLLLIAINAWLSKARPKRRKLLNTCIIIAGCLDIVENIGMLRFLNNNSSYPVLLFSIPAMLKFLLLIMVILIFIVVIVREHKPLRFLLSLLRSATLVLQDIFIIFRNLPLTVLSLAILLFITWFSDQGQDILLTINSFSLGPMTMYAVIIVLAMMNWHFPKFFYNVNWKTTKFWDLFSKPFDYPPDINNDMVAIPRLFGVLTFFIPAFGMLRALEVFRVGYLLSFINPMILLIITAVIIQLLFRYNYFQKFYTARPRLFKWVCLLLLVSPLLFWPFNHSRPIDIQWLFFGLLAYGILFAMITANRWSLAAAFPWFNNKRVTVVVWLCIAIPVLLFIAYFACNIFYCPGLPVAYMTFAVVMSAIIFYYALFAILNVLGIKMGVNISLLLVVIMIIVSMGDWNTNHFVDQQPGGRNKSTLDEYMAKWVRDRKDHIPKGDSVYEIYIVNTYGGGIRAAAWTCLTIAKLDSMQKVKDGGLFQDHVIAYSGASGGTVGASILCANGFAKHDTIPLARYVRFFSYDFLTPVLTGTLGNDVAYGGLHIHGNDRSKVQEHLWEHNYRRVFGSDVYGRTVDKLWDSNSTQVPLLFSNTTDYKYGKKGIFAPVEINYLDFLSTTIVRTLIDSNKNLKLSTAAFLSARFPFISPAGGFASGNYFLDGGIVENTGAETALEIYKVLRRTIDTLDGGQYKKYFRINVLSLKNVVAKDQQIILEKNKNISQLLAPISGAVNVGVVGNSVKAEYINSVYFFHNKDSDKYFRIEPISRPIKIEPTYLIFFKGDTICADVPLPLGWSISHLALSSMVSSIDSLSRPGGGLYKIMYQ